MLRLVTMILLGVFSAGLAMTGSAAEEVVAAPSTGRTEATIFMPALPATFSSKGVCWTPSIAVPRAGAWRCAIGNGINDPCFSVPGSSDGVVCGANPAISDPGFLMRLKKPLPAVGGGIPSRPSPWIVELAIGQGQVPGPNAMPPPKTFCSRLTGTMPVVDGQAVPFSCWEVGVDSQPKLGDTQIGLLDDFKPGTVWTVTEVTYVVDPKPAPNQPPFKLTSRKTIALEEVWE